VNPASPSANDSLAAWIGDCTVGFLKLDAATGQLNFDYSDDWRRREGAYPLSPALPFRRDPAQPDALHSASVRRFFENLLPEGKSLDDAAAAHGLSKSNLFGLMRALGRESAGAVALLPPGETPHAHDAMRAIGNDELSMRIRDRLHQPFSVWDGKVRLSIAGYQDKLAVYLDAERRMSLVEGALASTHILKPMPSGDRLPHLVANEHFCMRLAAAAGVPSARVEIARVPEPVLMVERFDRLRLQGSVERLHIVDACQALDLPAAWKYERNFGSGRDVAHIRDGMSLEKLFALTAMSPTAAVTRLALLRWTLFQVLIGNSDAHGKNLSFFVDAAGLRLAPAYDMVGIAAYPNLDNELAMAIGDVFDLRQVGAYAWADFAGRCGIDRRLLAREMRRIVAAVRKSMPALLADPAYLDEERAFLQDLHEFILQQLVRLEECATAVPAIRDGDA
jgi:serine/threonine-protein kinase HipA